MGLKDILQEKLEERKKKRRDAEYREREATDTAETPVKIKAEGSLKIRDGEVDKTDDEEVTDQLEQESALINGDTKTRCSKQRLHKIELQRVIPRPESSLARVFGGPSSALSRHRVTPSPLGESLSVYPSVINSPMPTDEAELSSRILSRLSSASGNSRSAFGNHIDRQLSEATSNSSIPDALHLHSRNKILPPLRREHS